jgi:hypothetical protein
MMKTKSFLTISCVLLLFSVSAKADSISPDTFSATLGVGESVTITKTVTVTEEPGSEIPVDVFFLTDSTGSMYSAINQVKASAAAVLAGTSGVGDVAWGVGEYRDIYDSFTYRTNQDITSNEAAVQAGINNWYAGGGGDWYEANLFALEQVAETVSWRPGSTRILVWFGDAPGHDPRAGSTEASATAALQAANISVEGIDMGLMDYTGQVTRIAAATGGHVYSGVSTSALVSTIISAVGTAIDTYSTVSLDLSGAPAGVTVTASPGVYAGSYDRSVERTFDFDVTFTGDAVGDYMFNIHALVDGGVVATEDDHIIVPVPGALLLGMLGLSVAGVRLRKRA